MKDFRSYASDFSSLVAAEIKLGLNEKLGVTGALRAAVHDIEAKLKLVDDPRLTSLMLMMRRHEKDFMLRRDPKYIGELKKATGRIRERIVADDDGSVRYRRADAEARKIPAGISRVERDGTADW